MPKKIYNDRYKYTKPNFGHLSINEEYTVPKNAWLEDSPYVCPKNKGMPPCYNIPTSDKLYALLYKKAQEADPRSKADDAYEDLYWKDRSMETRSETKLREQTLQVLERKLI